MNDYESLQINWIQHYLFCKRQWALMALEDVWVDNSDTLMGHHMHEKAHDVFFTERRGDKVITRGLLVASERMRIHGITDVVEFHRVKDKGVELANYEGYYQPYLIEYKKGKPKKSKSDILQLVAQAYCMEEMHSIEIQKSAIYYKKTNRRKEIDINGELRIDLENTVLEMRKMLETKKTPKAEKNKNCKRCSLREKCWPRITTHKKSVKNYLEKHLEE